MNTFILACNGGVQQFPSSQPIVSSLPSITSTSAPSVKPSVSHSPAYCTDRPGWYDSYGWTCETYEYYDDACSNFGDYDAGEGGLTANEACCGK